MKNMFFYLPLPSRLLSYLKIANKIYKTYKIYKIYKIYKKKALLAVYGKITKFAQKFKKIQN